MSMQRTIVIGDVQGCREELEELVRECGWRRGERLVLAGDLVAKGPDSAGVVARAREWGAEAVLGNHDARVLHIRAVQTGRVADDGRKAKAAHQRVVDTLRPADWTYLEVLPLFLRLGPERFGDPDTVVVHAGALPGVPLERQKRVHLLTLRSIDDDGEAKETLDGEPWAALWTGPERIVFGHDALRGLQEHPYAVGLDTGCVYGGALTALVLPERRLVSVPARRSYVAR
jgi:hypothetical protein